MVTGSYVLLSDALTMHAGRSPEELLSDVLLMRENLARCLKNKALTLSLSSPKKTHLQHDH